MKLLKSIYLTGNFYVWLGGLIVFFIISQFIPLLYGPALFAGGLLTIAALADFVLLYYMKNGIEAERQLPERMSNGDFNDIHIQASSNYDMKIHIEIIDELPVQFQKRDFGLNASLDANSSKQLKYQLRPVRRGEYTFGAMNLFAETFLHLFKRRYIFSKDEDVKVYPSFIQLKKYEQLVFANQFYRHGLKRIRKLGHTMEFEHVAKYTRGDDYRTINWKASARRNELMVNKYQDETQQFVISAIDTGRQMKMPFNGMTLLDHAINSSLALSNIILHKKDKAGLITFSNNIQNVVYPNNKNDQLRGIMEALYRQETDFAETDFAFLNMFLRRKVSKRSLVLLFTNFESFQGMMRNIESFRLIARHHLLVVVFFENTELSDLISSDAESTSDIYQKVVAEKLSAEKRRIISELEKFNIHSIYTPPEELSTSVINRYLEIKARRLI